MEKTIFRVTRGSTTSDGMATTLLKDAVFGGDVHDKVHTLETYRRTTEEVQAALGSDRLFASELGPGWEPLCSFLGCPVPETPYPSRNQADQFYASLDRLEPEGSEREGH